MMSYYKYAKYVMRLCQQPSARTSSAFSVWTDYSLAFYKGIDNDDNWNSLHQVTQCQYIIACKTIFEVE